MHLKTLPMLAGSSEAQRFNPKTSLDAWLLQSPQGATTIDIPAHFVSGDDPIVLTGPTERWWLVVCSCWQRG